MGEYDAVYSVNTVLIFLVVLAAVVGLLMIGLLMVAARVFMMIAGKPGKIFPGKSKPISRRAGVDDTAQDAGNK